VAVPVGAGDAVAGGVAEAVGAGVAVGAGDGVSVGLPADGNAGEQATRNSSSARDVRHVKCHKKSCFLVRAGKWLSLWRLTAFAQAARRTGCVDTTSLSIKNQPGQAYAP
jgi:hypothetical protein